MIKTLSPLLFIPLPVLSTPALLALAMIPLVAGLVRSRRPLTRRGGWRRGSGVVAETVHPAEMLVTQMQADAHSSRLVRLLGRVHRLRPAIDAARQRLAHVERERQRLQDEVDETSPLAKGDPEPVLGHRAATTLRVLAYCGDLVVVSTAIQVESRSITPLLALVLSLAVSTALFLLGDLVGHHLRELPSMTTGSTLIGSVALLLAMSASMLLLRTGALAAWLVLALTPAVGAALIVVLGPSPMQWRLIRASKRLGWKERTHARVGRKVARLQGRLDGLTEQARGQVRGDMLAVLAEAQGTGVVDPIVDAERLAARTGLDLFPDVATVPSDRLGAEEDGELLVELDDPTKVIDVKPFPRASSVNGSSHPVADFQ